MKFSFTWIYSFLIQIIGTHAEVNGKIQKLQDFVEADGNVAKDNLFQNRKRYLLHLLIPVLVKNPRENEGGVYTIHRGKTDGRVEYIFREVKGRIIAQQADSLITHGSDAEFIDLYLKAIEITKIMFQ